MVDMLSDTGENVGLLRFEQVLQDTSEYLNESEETERAMLCNVSSEFQVTLRLLGKKDAVTKLKVSLVFRSTL